MRRPVFIGPETEAAGYRLTGARVLTLDGRDGTKLLQEARHRASLVLISAAALAGIDDLVLAEALRSGEPPVALLPAMFEPATPPDLEREVRSALGVL